MKIVNWWSGGITSAVACKISIDLFGAENNIVLFIDTFNEDKDTYRFKEDCEKWYGIPIQTLTAIDGEKYRSIEDVWVKFKSLNVANGAICSSELKRAVRLKWEKENEYDYQVIGFDIDEPKRAKSMTMNYPKAKTIYPLLLKGLTKKDCLNIITEANIDIPKAYKLGFHNNNCLNTGCVQGGIGYWQKMEKDFPEKFDKMAKVEHDLTDIKGKPVTMLKDQAKGGGLIFLKPHPNYPDIKDISMKKGRPPKPLFECNSFGCGVNDLEEANKTQLEINYEE